MSDRPPLRHQTAMPRHQLLRDLQPAPRPARRPAQGPDHHRDGNGYRHRRRVVRVRCDRVRNRFRRHDGCPGGGRHRGPRWPHAQAQVGGRTEDLPRAHHGGVPQPVHGHRSGQPIGAVEHGRVDRATRRLDHGLCRRHAASGLHHDRADRDRRGGLGAARQRLCRHHAPPEGQVVVHGRQRARQAACVPAVHRWGRALPGDLRRGGRTGLPRLRVDRAVGHALQRRRRESAATRRPHDVADDGRARPAAARLAAGCRGTGILRRAGPAAPARSGCRRDHRRHLAWRGR